MLLVFAFQMHTNTMLMITVTTHTKPSVQISKHHYFKPLSPSVIWTHPVNANPGCRWSSCHPSTATLRCHRSWRCSATGWSEAVDCCSAIDSRAVSFSAWLEAHGWHGSFVFHHPPPASHLCWSCLSLAGRLGAGAGWEWWQTEGRRHQLCKTWRKLETEVRHGRRKDEDTHCARHGES